MAFVATSMVPCWPQNTPGSALCASSKVQQQGNKVASSAVSCLRAKWTKKKIWDLIVHVQGYVTVLLLQVHSVILIQLFVPNRPPTLLSQIMSIVKHEVVREISCASFLLFFFFCSFCGVVVSF